MVKTVQGDGSDGSDNGITVLIALSWRGRAEGTRSQVLCCTGSWLLQCPLLYTSAALGQASWQAKEGEASQGVIQKVHSLKLAVCSKNPTGCSAAVLQEGVKATLFFKKPHLPLANRKLGRWQGCIALLGSTRTAPEAGSKSIMVRPSKSILARPGCLNMGFGTVPPEELHKALHNFWKFPCRRLSANLLLPKR